MQLIDLREDDDSYPYYVSVDRIIDILIVPAYEDDEDDVERIIITLDGVGEVKIVGETQIANFKEFINKYDIANDKVEYTSPQGRNIRV